MRSLRVLLVWAGVALALAGCGGGGSSKGSKGGPPPTEKTRQKVFQVLAGSQMAMMQGGFQSSAQADAMNGAETGRASMMLIGSYVRGLGAQAMLVGRKARPQDDDGGGSVGGGGSGGDDGTDDDWNPDFYYDEYLGLWVENQFGEQEWTTLLWVDEAKTEPAGSFRTIFEGSYDAYPVRYLSVYEITAGTAAGANGRYEVVQTDEANGSMSYESHWPGYGNDEGASTWSTESTTWRSYSSLEDGSWFRHEGTFNADGTGSSTSENSDGYRWTYRYFADGSGEGLIEGPDPGLPAKVTWRDGKYRIEYADGTVEEWDFGAVSVGSVRPD
ncbi:MAG TPA: hypothetical protein VGE01_12290 [Fimbriimonas sp.]